MKDIAAKTMTTKPELTEKQQAFINALFGEAKGVIAEAGRLSDVAEPYAMHRHLRDVILDMVEHRLALNAPKAVGVIEDAMDEVASQVPGLPNRLSAAKEVLDRVGITKKDKVQVDINQGGVILLPAKQDARITE